MDSDERPGVGYDISGEELEVWFASASYIGLSL